MSEWLTYRTEDFLLFSERVYWRLFELQNEALWPAPVFALLIGAGLAVHILWPRPWSGRFVGPALAFAWAFAAVSFLWSQYATVNWAAGYVAPVFLVEALLLAWAGLGDNLHFRGIHDARRVAGFALFSYSVFVHPLVPVLDGRPIGGAEIFGLAPDPTAIATLGVILAASGRRGTLILSIVPLLWCLASFMTLHAIGTWEAWIPMAAAAVAVAGSMLGGGTLRNADRS